MIALENILVATDFSEPSEAALRYGMELARRFSAALHVLHVVDDLAAHAQTMPGMPVDLSAVQTTIENEARATLAALVPEPDRSAVRAHLDVTVSASPGRAILAYARDTGTDLIIVGTHGRHGLAHLLLGSVAEHVCRAAPCPVLTVRAHARDFIQPDVPQACTRSRLESGGAIHVEVATPVARPAGETSDHAPVDAQC